MFEAARKSMPAIDYVSIVRSVYKDRRAMVLGALTCVIGAGASAIRTGSPVLAAIAMGFVLITIFRYIAMTAFLKADIGPTDVEAAAKCELRATYFATSFAALAGFWCFASFVFVEDSVSELMSMATVIGCMVGIVTRELGLALSLAVEQGLPLRL